MSDSVLHSTPNEISARENRSQRDWKTLIGQICAVLAVLLGILFFIIFGELAPSDSPRCLVVAPGWQIIGFDAASGDYLCLQSETGLYQVACPVSVVNCP